jgi:hypothetical protein
LIYQRSDNWYHKVVEISVPTKYKQNVSGASKRGESPSFLFLPPSPPRGRGIKGDGVDTKEILRCPFASLRASAQNDRKAGGDKGGGLPTAKPTGIRLIKIL